MQKKSNIAYCLLSDENQNNEFVCNGGTTESIGQIQYLIAINFMRNRIREKKRYTFIISILVLYNIFKIVV